MENSRSARSRFTLPERQSPIRAHELWRLHGRGVWADDRGEAGRRHRGDSACSDRRSGAQTSAYLALRLCWGDFDHVVVPFDEIIPRILDGTVMSGLIIHEGQLTYADHGLEVHLNLGTWWGERTGACHFLSAATSSDGTSVQKP